MDTQSGVQVHLGRYSAKVENRDELLNLMRQVVQDMPQADRAAHKAEYIKRILNHDNCAEFDEIIYNAFADNQWARCVRRQDPEQIERRERLKEKAKDIIEASIVLWNWVLPTTGKPLNQCTFEEVRAAAPVVDNWLLKLAGCGAPGTMVREVFRNKKALQEFWTQAQQ